jgi:hypothetical protein
MSEEGILALEIVDQGFAAGKAIAAAALGMFSQQCEVNFSAGAATVTEVAAFDGVFGVREMKVCVSHKITSW